MYKMRSDTFHKGKYYVTFKRGFEDYKKDITLSIDKVFENDSLRILLSDEEDPNFLCILNVTRVDYEDLKKQQGLLIDFDNFPSQLVRLLQQCATNNMFLIMQQTNPVQYFFEVVEHNEFRRLVHLSLRTAPASDAEIKKHMAENILQLKKTLSATKGSLTSSESLWNDKCMTMERKIHELTLTITKMDEERLRKETEYQESLRHERDRFAQEKLKWQRSSDMNTQAQVASVQATLSRKESQVEELSAHVRQLKDNVQQMENQISEKNQKIVLLEKELQKSHVELATTKAKSVSVERDLGDKERQYHQASSRCCDLEKTIRDQNNTIKELQTSVQTLKKEKASLEERLSLSEALASKNTEAAHCASEQLLKANQIIAKQNADILEIKDKLLCRTAIALEQEKVIERNTKETEDLKKEIATTRQSMEKLNGEIDNLKERLENNEKALKDKEEIIKNNNLVIQWLHKKMEDNCESEPMRRNKMASAATSSTPYFLASKNHSGESHEKSDESINFYATSKLSNIEDSPQVEALSKERRVGLDPKYLAPAVDDHNSAKETRKKGSGKAPTSSQRGKENINVNLPKVDYREKKNTKGSGTYRPTPVSAYFH